MAKGDVTLFNEFAADFANKLHNLKDTDVIKLGLVTDVTTPLVASTARWATFSANDVSAAGGYTAGGLTLAYTVATRWALAAGVGTYDADDVELAQDAGGFTDARWGIIYNDTATNDEAIGFLDLGGDVSEVAGPIKIEWNVAGILTVTVNP